MWCPDNFTVGIEILPSSLYIDLQANNIFNSGFHDVVDSLLLLYKSNVKLPTNDTTTSTKITNNFKFEPYFSDCLRALDETHVEMHVPTELQPRYRNRKGTLSQNILAVCNFEMQFVYILAGWEGSVHDARVLQDAQGAQGFKTVSGKYWLGILSFENHF